MPMPNATNFVAGSLSRGKIRQGLSENFSTLRVWGSCRLLLHLKFALRTETTATKALFTRLRTMFFEAVGVLLFSDHLRQGSGGMRDTTNAQSSTPSLQGGPSGCTLHVVEIKMEATSQSMLNVLKTTPNHANKI